MTEQTEKEDVQFWFDPLCPWAWITSRWMLEVEKVRPVRTDWRIMSLAYLNLEQHKGEGLSPEYLERMSKAWLYVRVCAAAAEQNGPGIYGPLYHSMSNTPSRLVHAAVRGVRPEGPPIRAGDRMEIGRASV